MCFSQHVLESCHPWQGIPEKIHTLPMEEIYENQLTLFHEGSTKQYINWQASAPLTNIELQCRYTELYTIEINRHIMYQKAVDWDGFDYLKNTSKTSTFRVKALRQIPLNLQHSGVIVTTYGGGTTVRE